MIRDCVETRLSRGRVRSIWDGIKNSHQQGQFELEDKFIALRNTLNDLILPIFTQHNLKPVLELHRMNGHEFQFCLQYTSVSIYRRILICGGPPENKAMRGVSSKCEECSSSITSISISRAARACASRLVAVLGTDTSRTIEPSTVYVSKGEGIGSEMVTKAYKLGYRYIRGHW